MGEIKRRKMKIKRKEKEKGNKEDKKEIIKKKLKKF